MDIKKIEEVIKLVKANDVKKFKYKDSHNEIELDFTNGASQQHSQQSSQDIQQENIKSLDEKQDPYQMTSKRLNLLWLEHFSYKIVKN